MEAVAEKPKKKKKEKIRNKQTEPSASTNDPIHKTKDENNDVAVHHTSENFESCYFSLIPESDDTITPNVPLGDKETKLSDQFESCEISENISFEKNNDQGLENNEENHKISVEKYLTPCIKNSVKETDQEPPPIIPKLESDIEDDTQKTSHSLEKLEGQIVNEDKTIVSYEVEKDIVPKIDTESINKFLDMNKQILKTINDVQFITEEVTNFTNSKVEINITKEQEVIHIKPYTEQQLSALYHNSELDTLEEFCASFVEAELKGLAVKQHSLYELLSNYLKVREKITGNNLELSQLRKEYKDLQNELWTVESATVNGRGECQDGQILTATHSYRKSIFHRAVFQSVIRILGNIRKILYENHTLFSYSAEDLRLQIDLFLQSVIFNCLSVIHVNKNSPVLISMQAEPDHLKPYIGEVRLCISVLFAFQRKLIRDAQFLRETREWLRQLVAVLLRLANYQDHLFLMNHILRCPAGVGSWGSNFIQLPLDEVRVESPFASYEINHFLTMLAAILMPIKEREVFLKDIAHNKDGTTEALWVLVDSEGEEDEENAGTSLKENDLVALVNQLPLDDLFRKILLVFQKDNKDIYDSSLITQHHLLRFLAFSTVLIKLFHRGLQTYNQPRYNQFSKRLSRLIRHVVQYTTDQWEHFLKVHHLSDAAMLERLQTEYDAFFLRAIYFLYSSQKMGAWQFLAVVPYNLVTPKTMWKIFYFLHNSDRRAEEILNPLDMEDYSKKLWEKELREQFEDKLDKLEDAEVYYLLNTFANMALARTDQDMEFISTAVMDLLQVGFISETTQESCSKSARILLTHLTSKHPHLLSAILKTVKENLDRIKTYAIYLYEELPLTIWKLEETDLDLIKGLLLNNPISSDESRVARMILSRLNWDLLPHEFHCETAILVLKAVEIEPGYLQWGWQMILRLKLHISDKHFKELGRVEEPERFEVLSKGIREGQPLAAFVALLMTSWGHLVPLILGKGLEQLLFLQSQQKHEAVLFALYQIVPLFLSSQECIINCDKFQEILLNLLNADRGYISYAKSFIMTQNTVLQQFGNMIETQIVNYAYYDLHSPRCLVRLWMNSLVSIPNWNKDSGILYLLDVLIKNAFFHKDALEVIHDILMNLHQCGTPQESPSIINVFKWVSTNTSANSLITNSLATYPWLAYIFLDIENLEREIKTGMWRELLIELSKQKGKINVDQAIKKAAATAKITPFSSGWLCIYRWAQQALDTPVDHPLLPLIWQQFFTLYLNRIPTISAADKICVGSRFFDGLVNFAFQKKIKKRLQDTVDYYRTELEEMNEEIDDREKINLYRSCLKIFLAFQLWLEEPRLQESNLLLQCLPPQYEPNLVAFIVQGDKTPWFQFLDYERLKKDRLLSIRTWRIANFREKTNANKPLPNPGANVESSDPLERILRRLKAYDKPKAPPDVVHKAPVMPTIDFACKESMFKSLEPCFKTLKQFAHNHTLKVSEHKALDCSYQELMPQLYRSVLNKVKKTVPCKGKNQTVHCSGAAVIILEMQEARVNERIEHQIQTNRSAFESLIERSLEAPSLNLYSASVTIQHCVKILQSQLKCNPATAELGVELFYRILSMFSEETSSYLPTRTLFAICLEKLGQSHIYGMEYEMPGLLQRILKEPNLSCYLAPHFSPSNVGTASMLLMYSTICKEVGQKYDIAFTLLSKFEVDKWLNTKNPKLSQRSKFIESVISALSALGFDPPIEALMLHGLYRRHLLTVFEFQFPEHYGEVFMHLLKVSNGNPENNCLIAKSVWLDVLNSLSRPSTINPKLPLRDQLRQYAQHQKLLHHQELLDTAELLSRHFTQERLQYGLYGLYPKCRNYMDIFSLLLGMTGHALIVSMLNTHQGLLGDKLCEKIWPYLRDMFAPWLVPYSMQNLKENMASWIQQLADDRSILLPWISSDTGLAQKVISVFFECVSFILHTLPASSSILSYLWQWYVSSFAHTSVKDHILIPIHQVFAMFPWHNFWPSVYDLEFMLKVVDQYLPDCHSFLGHVFMSVPWANWLNNFASSPPQVKARVYHCFLNLMVKLINEPNVRKNNAEKMKSLVVQAENFDWSFLEPTGYQHVMDWIVMSFDASIIFKRDPLDLDHRLLHFLKTVAGYHKSWPESTPVLLLKRTIFVKTFIKLLSIYVSRHKSTISSCQNQIYTTLLNHLVDMEQVVTNQEEMNVLLNELLTTMNITDISETVLKVFLKWVQNKPSDGIVIRSLVRCAGLTVNDVKCLADLYEGVLNCYFSNTVGNGDDPTWKEVSELITILPSKQTDLEQVLFETGAILTLNALLARRVKKTVDKEAMLNTAIEWVEKVKINEHSEPKVPLLWFSILQLALDYCDRDEATAGALLYRFSKVLLQVSELKGASGWGRGLLSAIGITQNGAVSMNFRFVCRALAAYILAQLPDMKGEPQTVRRQENAPFKVGQPGGSTECTKVLMVLDFGQSQGKIKECAEMALKKIQDPSNSLHNAKSFLWLLLKQFYIKPYLKDVG